MTTDDYARHIVEVCRRERIQLRIDPKMSPDRASATQFISPRGVRVKPSVLHVGLITEAATYAVYLHELGHCLAPDNSGVGPGGRHNYYTMDLPTFRHVLRAEAAAWTWARENAIEWTIAMEQCRHLAIRQYLKVFHQRFPKETAWS